MFMYSISFVGAQRFSVFEPYLYTCFVGTPWTGGHPVVRSASAQDETNSEIKQTYINVSRGLESNVSVSEI